ncbi:hypothetical protein CTAYLR_007177 [Chrysophaeum taylorii]|uniref:Peptidyl-prolyl cis-trans isomerase n=1 Tax=Chrysophaeum taylorii TaxID=2483200 RepID=A0AAD7XQC9_9STRA|nr:hypothetical protein CTAYLR_007177 [Chrysophaeum taylorii]
MAVLVQTAVGNVVVDLFVEEECAPLCASFLKLCGAKYYHGCLFYNVQPGCLAQTGDPEGTGRGGTGADNKLITWDGKSRKHDALGLVSLANMGGSGRRVFGSQFFVTLRGEDLGHLDAGGHAVIGEVAEGLEVLRTLSNLYLDEAGRPWEDVRVRHTHVLDDPLNEAPARVPESPTRDRPPREKVMPRVAYGESSKKPKDNLTDYERQEIENEKKAKSQAQVLEMIGDLPHADVEVPKNELFVCKLNKVTEDHDLEIIFSRFGKIESCDIVRDWKTGDSLNFAFITFEEEDAAVAAYRKMNGALVDDSRIKVDFSQSVAKIWSRYTLQYKGAAARERKLKLARQLQHDSGRRGHYAPAESRRRDDDDDDDDEEQSFRRPGDRGRRQEQYQGDRFIRHFERRCAEESAVCELTDMEKAAFVLLQRPIPSHADLVVQAANIDESNRAAAGDDDEEVIRGEEDTNSLDDSVDDDTLAKARKVGRPSKKFKSASAAKASRNSLITSFFKPKIKLGRRLQPQ